MNETAIQLLQQRIDSIKEELALQENHPLCLRNNDRLNVKVYPDTFGTGRIKSELSFLEALLESMKG